MLINARDLKDSFTSWTDRGMLRFHSGAFCNQAKQDLIAQENIDTSQNKHIFLHVCLNSKSHMHPQTL